MRRCQILKSPNAMQEEAKKEELVGRLARLKTPTCLLSLCACLICEPSYYSSMAIKRSEIW